MFGPLPYTPETVKRIREAAPIMSVGELARALGWEVNRIERVARQHSIEIRAAKNGATAQEVVVDRAPMSVGVAKGLHSGSREIPNRSWTSRAITLGMTLEDITDALPPKQSQLFAVLVGAGVNGKPLIAEALAIRGGVSVRSLRTQVCMMRVKLRPTQWTIEGMRGSEGGYRLITTRGGA